MKDLLRHFFRPGLLALGLFIATPTYAQFTEGGTSDPNTSSPGEDIGTVPAHSGDSDDTRGDAGSGLILVGRPSDLHRAITDIRGSGTVAFAPFRSSGGSTAEMVKVSFFGDMNLVLDARAVSSLGIGVFFEPAEGSTWVVQVGFDTWRSRRFQLKGGRPMAVPLSLLRPWRAGPISIDAAASRTKSARMNTSLVGDTYRLQLRSRR